MNCATARKGCWMPRTCGFSPANRCCACSMPSNGAWSRWKPSTAHSMNRSSLAPPPTACHRQSCSICSRSPMRWPTSLLPAYALQATPPPSSRMHCWPLATRTTQRKRALPPICTGPMQMATAKTASSFRKAISVSCSKASASRCPGTTRLHPLCAGTQQTARAFCTSTISACSTPVRTCAGVGLALATRASPRPRTAKWSGNPRQRAHQALPLHC
ncbi:hypothetical protein D3C72_1724790 [compost metagenome]